MSPYETKQIPFVWTRIKINILTFTFKWKKTKVMISFTKFRQFDHTFTKPDA
ncbi:hypothetical protein SARI_01156 [Salmonella enterica subsp. arizonae serovar 62:z4,z23:-]|uniref:Uncharacterized protein n=1 Tax=Salmonella arizonae (strain ATCC BAA-731 / CDC346-86 / RSK2980) TaxID=41514 RepID=A9MP80_SALAR|nr:hypothetical protein SARI_01156 [Salmonella enterica subsp. arizonae serovar 62:z4,z23:-]